MNIRKNIDNSELYASLDHVMAAGLKQMDQYCEIGKAVCRRSEKGAVVAAAEYLSKNYPDVPGFSPRNLRRMRDFYRTYEHCPRQLSLAMKIGWTQNVVIMEADLAVEVREWYLKAVEQFGWSKVELIEKITTNAHKTLDLNIVSKEYCAVEDNSKDTENSKNICVICEIVFSPDSMPIQLLKCLSKIKRRCFINRYKSNPKLLTMCSVAYLSKQYSDAHGFSPRNLRRMWDF